MIIGKNKMAEHDEFRDIMKNMEIGINEDRKKGNITEQNNCALKLLNDLETKLKSETDNNRIIKIKKIINAAKNGYYSDFDSPNEMCLMTLASQFSELGYHDLHERMARGEYDHPFTPVLK